MGTRKSGSMIGVAAAAMGIGAALMYVLDPVQGRGRRAVIRDRAGRAARRTREALRSKSRDLGNRVAGLKARASGLMSGQEEIPDEVLFQRVRAQLGHVAHKPSTIGVSVVDGYVILEGTALSQEVAGLLQRIRSLRGVRGVENRLMIDEGAPAPTP